MSGEIELLQTRALTHIVGHDAAGLAGRLPVPPDLIDTVSSPLTPFSGQIQAIATHDRLRASPAGFWAGPGYRLWRATTLATQHYATDGSYIIASFSEDFGQTWVPSARRIFGSSTDTVVRGAAIGNMAAGRVGGIVTTGETTRKTWFIRSDDGGSTWAVTDVTSSMTYANHLVFGPMIAWPARLGGDDTSGFCVISCFGGTAGAKAIYTVDNGATWADKLLKPPGGAAAVVSETCPVVTDDGLLLYARTSGAAAVMAVAKAANLTGGATDLAFTAWVNTGVTLGESPPHVLFDGGKVSALIPRREGWSAVTAENTLEVVTKDATAVWAAGGSLSGGTTYTIAALPSRLLGYFYSAKLGTHYAHYFVAGESVFANMTDAALNSEFVLRQMPGALPPAQAAPAPRNVLRNSDFSRWTRGTSWTGITVPTAICDSWKVYISGAIINASRVMLTADQSAMFANRPRYGLKYAVTGGASPDYAGIYQTWLGEDARSFVRAFSRVRSAISVCGFGRFFPAGGRVSLLYYTAAAPTTAVIFAGTAAFPTQSDQDGPFYTEAALVGAELTVDIDQIIRAEMIIGAGADNTLFEMTLTGISLVAGSYVPEMQPVDEIGDAARCNNYVQTVFPSHTAARAVCTMSYTSTTSATGIVDIDDMAGASTVTPVLANYTLAGNSTFTALTAAVNGNQVVLTATVSGGAVGTSYPLMQIADAPALLADTGY